MDKIIIVASGPSIAQLNQLELSQTNSMIIAVNGGADWLGYKYLDYFFSLDPSRVNIERTNKVDWFSIPYFAIDGDVPSGLNERTKILKRLSNKGEEPEPRHSLDWFLWRWSCLEGLAESKDEIHTGNSSYGALNLAYHFRPKKILLLGVDANQEPRVNDEGPPKYSLSHLPILFSTAVPQLERAGIEVVNGSPHSKLTCFRKMRPDMGLRWIKT